VLRFVSRPALSRRLFPKGFNGMLSTGAAIAPFLEGS
jgi:hypothetical protein